MAETAAIVLRRGKPWSAKEDASLMRHVFSRQDDNKPRLTLVELCSKHGRTSTALLYRIKKNLMNEFPTVTSASDLSVIKLKYPNLCTDLALKALQTGRNESGTATQQPPVASSLLLERQVQRLESRLSALETKLERILQRLSDKPSL